MSLVVLLLWRNTCAASLVQVWGRVLVKARKTRAELLSKDLFPPIVLRIPLYFPFFLHPVSFFLSRFDPVFLLRSFFFLFSCSTFPPLFPLFSSSSFFSLYLSFSHPSFPLSPPFLLFPLVFLLIPPHFPLLFIFLFTFLLSSLSSSLSLCPLPLYSLLFPLYSFSLSSSLS